MLGQEDVWVRSFFVLVPESTYSAKGPGDTVVPTLKSKVQNVGCSPEVQVVHSTIWTPALSTVQRLLLLTRNKFPPTTQFFKYSRSKYSSVHRVYPNSDRQIFNPNNRNNTWAAITTNEATEKLNARDLIIMSFMN